MSHLAELIAQHGENYDGDCSYHSGCTCGWPDDGRPDERVIEVGRRLWAEHLADVIASGGYIQWHHKTPEEES